MTQARNRLMVVFASAFIAVGGFFVTRYVLAQPAEDFVCSVSFAETPDKGYQHVSGSTFYYSRNNGFPSWDGTILATVTATSPGGAAYVAFPNVFSRTNAEARTDTTPPTYTNSYYWNWDANNAALWTLEGVGTYTVTCGYMETTTRTTTFTVVRDDMQPTLSSVTPNVSAVKSGGVINITTNGTDAASGISSCPAYLSVNTNNDVSGDVSLGDLGSDCQGAVTIPPATVDGTYYLKVKAGDNVGYWTNAISSGAISVDNIAPITSDDTVGGMPLYYQSSTHTPTFHLTSDDHGGSGVASTLYCIADAPETCTPDINGTTVPVACTNEGSCVKWIFYQSTDNAGNVETFGSHSYDINIYRDTVVPDTSDNYGGKSDVWQNANQSITLTPNDPTLSSGIAWTKYCTGSGCLIDNGNGNDYSGPVEISTEGTTYFRYASKDNAGNTQTVVERIVKIDTTAPALTIEGFTVDCSTDMAGNLTDGYTLNTNNTTADHTIQFKTGSVASENLKSEAFGLYLQPTAGQTDELVAYYASKPAEWRTYLNAAAAGIQPFAYIKGDGTPSITLLDGAQKYLAAVETDMVVPDDYPLGTYTVTGIVKDLVENESATITLKLIVAGDRVKPTLIIEGFTADGSTDMAGNLTDGYTLNTNNTTADHTIQFKTGSVASEALKSEVYGLTLVPTAGQTDELIAYYATKPPEYQTYLNAAAAGTQPFAYIKGSGDTSIQILDGAKYTLTGGVLQTDMYVPDDFPLGTYTVIGQVKDLAGNESEQITLKLIIAGDRVKPTASVVHDGAAKTITYTFSEPVQLISQADGTFTPLAKDLLGIYVIDGSYNYGPDKVTGAQILTANYASEVLTITYAGFLAQSVDTNFVVDAWGYSITDLAGNRIEFNPSQVFTVVGDTVAPTTSDNYGDKNDKWQRPPNTPEISLTPSDPDVSSGIAWTKYCIGSGCLINDGIGDSYTGAPVQISAEGTSYFRYASKDNAGNIQPIVERIVKFDSSGLQSSLITSPIQHSAIRGTITITADATDTVSGVAKVEFHHLSGTDVLIGEDTSAPYGVVWDTQDPTVGAADGHYMLMVKTFDVAGNSLESPQVAVTVDNTAPTATVSYDVTDPINSDVVATLNPSEPVTVTSPGGTIHHTFTANGSFTFEFHDAAGNTGSAVAIVNNIDKTDPTATISYDVTTPTNGSVVATLHPSETVIVQNNGGAETYTFTANGSFTFEFVDLANNAGIATATVSNIDISLPSLNITGFTADGSTDMAGTMPVGYTLQTTNDPVVDHTVQFKSGSVASENLKSEAFGLYLQPTTGQTTTLADFYSTKSEPWRTYLNEAAAGIQPFAYIKGSGDTSIRILDGARYSLAALEMDMVVPDNYPLGSYTVTGKVKDLAGNESALITLILNVAGDREKPVVTEVMAVTTPTNDSTPPYTFHTTEAGTIRYAGGCVGTDVDAAIGDNTVTFDALADGSYSSCTITVTDGSGNTSDPLTVTSFTIDTVVPTATISYDITTPTNTDVVATLNPSEPVTVTSVGGATHTFTANGSFTFEFRDVAGNTGSETATVSNIDLDGPTATISYSIETSTNGPVVATLVPSEPVTVTNNGGALTYTFTANGSFTFTFVDAGGNAGSAMATVANIDLDVPTATISYSITTPTNGPVVATLDPSEPVTVTNNSGLDTYTFTDNGSFIFEFHDAAGNTGSAIATVANIDKAGPTATISYNITTPTKTDVIATLVPSKPVTITNNGGLNTYTFTENGSFTFTFVDAAGNTGSATATVANIDKTAPVITLNGTTPDIAINGTYTELGATATDAFDGTFAATPSGTVDTSKVGSYVITYNATDKAGNAATAVIRTVNVVAAPLPALPPTAKPKEGTRAWYVAQGWHYIASLKELKIRVQEGRTVKLLGKDYFWKPKGQVLGVSTNTRAYYMSQGWRYIGTQKDKKLRIRQGKDVQVLDGNYYWRNKK